MSQEQLHPSQLKRIVDTQFRANLASWGLLAGALTLLACGSNAKTPQEKLGFFAGVVATALIASPIRKIAIDSERLGHDQADLSTTAYQNHFYDLMKPGSPVVLAPTEEEEAPIELLPLFDWGELADGDEHTLIGIVSPSGGGKSYLAKYLCKYILFPGETPETTVFDVYARSSHWQGATKIRSLPDMVEAMRQDLEAIEGRMEEYSSGRNDFPGLFRVVEEAADTLLNLRELGKEEQKVLRLWLSKFTTVTRKVRGRACIISCLMNAEDFGIKAEARNSSTIVFVGKKGIAAAMSDDRVFKLGTKQNKELREQLSESLAGVKRPAIIYLQGRWLPAAVPELTENGDPIGAIQSDFSQHIDRLNRLYESPDSPEDSEGDSPDQLTEIQEAILDLSERQGWIKAKDCQRSGWGVFRDKSADDIRAEFLTLIELRLGRGRYEGERLQFCSDEWNPEDSK